MMAMVAPPEVQAVQCNVVSTSVDETSMLLRVWMSEEAMVAAKITTGSLVAVSLPGLDSNVPVTSLSELWGSNWNVNIPSSCSKSFGAFHMVVEAWPSRKLTRFGIRLSKHLAISLGHPSMGSVILLNPITPSSKLEQSKGHVINFAVTGDIGDCTHVSLQWCPPLEVVLVPDILLPPPSPVLRTPSITSKKMGRTSSFQENSCHNSPSTPPSPVFKTPSSSSKRMARTSSYQETSGSQLKESFRHSPSPSPVGKIDGRRFEGSPGPKTAEEEIRLSVPNLGNIAAVRSLLSLEEENGKKGISLLEDYAARMFSGRYLLPGSLVTLRVCACDCLFFVSYVKMSSGREETANLSATGLLPPPPLSIYKVGHRTKVKFCGQLGVEPKAQPEEKGTQAPDEKADDEMAGKVLEEVKYSALGGLNNQIEEIKQIVHFSLLRPDLLAGYGLTPHRGILLYGPPGTGKSTLARAAACEAGVPLFAINGPDVVSQFYGESEESLRAIFMAAEEVAPAVVVIDEIDAIAPERKEGSEELAQRMVGALLKLMDEGANKRVLVIAATNRPNALDPALRRPGRFDKEVEIGVPSAKGRHEILKHFLSKLKHNLQDPELFELAAGTHGFVGADLSSLCHEAALATLRRYINWKPKSSNASSTALSPSASIQLKNFNPDFMDSELSPLTRMEVDTMSWPCIEKEAYTAGSMMGSLCTAFEGVQIDTTSVSHGSVAAEANGDCELKVTMQDFAVAKTRVRPSAMREIMLEVPKVKWADIGGLEDVKQQLQEAVIWPQQHADRLALIGAQPIRGVLLYGPPGCSKTLLARACASEAGLNFIAVKGPELFSKWVGESEKAVQALFARARAAAPSIVFFDEVDGLAVARSSGHSDGLSVGDRVMSQLLTEMDGLKPRTGVSVLAATNRPDIIDPALLRPGRFDRQLYVGPPNEVAREKIFKIQLRNTPYSPLVDLATLAARTPSYTGADISAVCRLAAMAALEEDLTAKQVELRHFETALVEVAPSNPGPNPEFSKFNRCLFT